MMENVAAPRPENASCWGQRYRLYCSSESVGCSWMVRSCYASGDINLAYRRPILTVVEMDDKRPTHVIGLREAQERVSLEFTGFRQ